MIVSKMQQQKETTDTENIRKRIALAKDYLIEEI